MCVLIIGTRSFNLGGVVGGASSLIRLPEAADELFVAYVAVAVHVVVAHKCLQLDLLWEDSTINERQANCISII